MTESNQSMETPEEFQLRARAWLADNMPRRPEGQGHLRNFDRCRELQKLLHEGGFAGVCFPAEYGGLGLTLEHQQALDEETMSYDMPLALNIPTFGIIGATLVEFGTHEQKQRYLPPMIRGEEIWVQFLSEPSSGSDLASLTMRATRDGDSFLLNGSKIWSSGAQSADYGICVARSNWDVPKHDGITVFIVKIKQPGIVVEEIVDTFGGTEFCQEFFDDVRISMDDVVGEVDAGWTVVRGLLAHERNSMGNASPLTSGLELAPTDHVVSDIVDIARTTGMASDPKTRQLVGENYALRFVQSETTNRISSGMARGQFPPTAGALLRLMGARAAVRRSDVALAIAGSGAAAWHEGDPAGNAGSRFVGRQAAEIGGGTTEMQRNIISERMLQMPRELAADRGIPFNEVRHNAATTQKSKK
ncbi:acyl-CoA dehydrogenase family protein [Myxococcota bacterium]|nr:acyl-CoA dehydrogenase family protein [Myxococcota bacterium]